jgi:hypothetical protein
MHGLEPKKTKENKKKTKKTKKKRKNLVIDIINVSLPWKMFVVAVPAETLALLWLWLLVGPTCEDFKLQEYPRHHY